MFVFAKTTSDDGYTYFQRTITQAEAKSWLANYLPLVKRGQEIDNSFYGVEFFDSPPGMRFGGGLSDDYEDSEFDSDKFYVVLHNDVVQESQVSAACIRFTKDGVSWSASPKNSEGYFETPELTWEDVTYITDGENPLPELERDVDG